MSLIIAVNFGETYICAAVFEPDQITPIKHRRIQSQGLKLEGFDRLVNTRATLRILALARISEEDPP
jgi:hypothetical protein